MKTVQGVFCGCWIRAVQDVSLRNIIQSRVLLSIAVGGLFAPSLTRALGQSPPPLETALAEATAAAGTASVSTQAPLGSFIVTLQPPEAVAAGAQWRLNGETAWHDSGIYYTNLPIGLYMMEFKPISGWLVPKSNRPVSISRGGYSSVSVSYTKILDFTFTVTATNGFVGGRAFPSNQLPFFETYSLMTLWLNARLPAFSANPLSSSSNFFLPYQNANYWVQLLGVPLSGYQFSGWSGSATGSRNPMVVLLNENKEITAQFTPVSRNSFTATHLADDYFSPGTLVVNCQASYPIERELLSLKWRPILPEQWTFISATGLDKPVIADGAVVVTGAPVGNNPVHFNLMIQVPDGEFGSKEIRGEITYTLNGMTDPTNDFPSPNPLVIPSQESPAARLSMRQSSEPPTLEIRGSPGKAYVLQQTSDPFQTNNWQWLGILTLTNSVQTWIDTEAATNQPVRFYQAIYFQ